MTAVAIAGAGAAFLILGVAGVSWRAQCSANPNAGICFFSGAPEQAASLLPRRAAVPVEPKVAELQTAEPQPTAEAPALPEPQLAAALPAPSAEIVPAQEAAVDPEFAKAGEMMASTFEVLSALKASINGLDGAGEPIPPTAAATTPAPASAPATEVATAELETPAPLVPASLAPQSPVKRTVKIIPITPTSLATNSAAATAAQQLQAAAAPTQVAAVSPAADVEPLAFATAQQVTPPVRSLSVTDNLVNVRSGPDTKSDRLFVLAMGDTVRALSTAGEWVEIEDEKGRSGWARAEFFGATDLTSLPKNEAPTAAEAEEDAPTSEEEQVEVASTSTSSGDTRTVLGSGVNVRSGPSTGSEKLFALTAGRTVTVTEDQRGWLKVVDDQGRTGWLYKDYVTGG